MLEINDNDLTELRVKYPLLTERVLNSPSLGYGKNCDSFFDYLFTKDYILSYLLHHDDPNFIKILEDFLDEEKQIIFG